MVGHLIWNWQHFLVWFHLLLGAAYAFHVTLTATTVDQTDITGQGCHLVFRSNHLPGEHRGAIVRHSVVGGGSWMF